MNETARKLTTNPFTYLIAPGLFLLMLGSPRFAYANRGIDGGAITAERMLASATTQVHIEGTLSCIGTTGKCKLQLHDEHTGKTYWLTGANRTAQGLLRAGTPKVAVEGTLINGGTVNVTDTKPL